MVMEYTAPSVDIVILHYNGKKYMERILPRLLSFTYPNYKIYVIDNGSDDQQVSFLVDQFPSIHVIRNNVNYGYSKGKNIGMGYATADYVLLLDDDILPEDVRLLEKLVSFYQTHPKAAFVSIPFIDWGGDLTDAYGLYTNRRKPSVPLRTVSDSVPFEIPCPMGGLLFFRKDIWDTVGGFDETFPYCLDDWDIGIRAYLLGYQNFLYTRSHAVHLGVQRLLDRDTYRWKYKYEMAGFMYTITKSYTVLSLFKWYVVGYSYFFYKTLRQIVRKHDVMLFYSFLISHWLFFRHIPRALKHRQRIQSLRQIPHDEFLNLAPPFDV